MHQEGTQYCVSFLAYVVKIHFVIITCKFHLQIVFNY